MSIGEELTDRPERGPVYAVGVIETFRTRSQTVQYTVERLIDKPTDIDLELLKRLQGQLADGVDIFNENGFFRDENKLIVCAAVGAIVDGLHNVIESIEKLDPGGKLVVELGVEENGEPLDSPKIEIYPGKTADIESRLKDVDEINKFADLIIENNAGKGDKLGNFFVDTSKRAHTRLNTELDRNPVIREFMDKKERKKNSALQIGGVAAAAFAGALLANLISRKRK